MKRLICVIISLVMIISVFTACSKADNSDTNQKNQENITIDTHYADIDESAVRAYEKLCDAVINYENEVKFNISLLDDVSQLFYTCFPLYPLVESIDFLEDQTGVSVTYVNSEEEHLSLVSQFFDKIEEIKAQCEYGSVNTDRYIFNVYTYITQNISIDNSVITTFDTALQGRGYSAPICSLFEYLVLQGGGKASHIMNLDAGANIISYVEFKGEWYYFNPVLDIQKNQGSSLIGFAMNDSRVGGLEFNYTDESPVDKATDNTFDKLESSVSYALEGDKVNVICADNESFVLDFS
ncbi:MAG: hypothetical protein J1E36_01610 [Eubacterium sp.]|nr:hypothetical protein [Eubacterium sp.]